MPLRLRNNKERSYKGKVFPGGSKSISNRLLIINALSPYDIQIQGLSEAEDVREMKTALDRINAGEKVIDAGSGGTTYRFLLAYLATLDEEYVLDCSEQMKSRTIEPLVDALQEMGAKIEYLEKNGFPPLRIRGGISGGEVEFNPDISSQFISALLLIGPNLPEGVAIRLYPEQVSYPYILMTSSIMERSGIVFTNEGNKLSVGFQQYRLNSYTVEIDWSSISYWFLLASTYKKSQFKIEGAERQSIQGDNVLSRWCEAFGVSFTWQDGELIIEDSMRSEQIKTLDLSQAPDLAPTLIMSAALNDLNISFTGIDHLVYKESNRIESINSLLEHAGKKISKDVNSNRWNMESIDETSKDIISIDSFNDHRIVMTAVGLLSRHEELIINDPEVVNKSYPNFWNDLETVGFELSWV